MLPQFGPPARLAGGGSKCSARCNAKSAASAALQRWCRSRSRRRWAADRGGGWLGPGNGPNLTKCLKMIKMSILESYHTKLSYILALNCLSRKLALANAGVSSYFSITLARDEADQMPNPWFCTWSSPPSLLRALPKSICGPCSGPYSSPPHSFHPFPFTSRLTVLPFSPA